MHAQPPRPVRTPVRTSVLLAALAAWAVLLAVGIPLWLRSDGSSAAVIGRTTPPGRASGQARAPVVFTSEEGRFTAEFPAEPERTETTNAKGLRSVQLASATERDGVARVTFADIDVAPGEAEAFLTGAADRAVGDRGGRLVSKRLTVMQGNPAVDFVVAEKEGSETVGRIVLAGTGQARAYALISERRSVTETAYDRLLETFTLTG